YIISFDIFSSSYSPMEIGVMRGTATDVICPFSPTQIISPGVWTKISVSVKSVSILPTISNQVIYIGLGKRGGTNVDDYYILKNLKFMEGDKDFPWTPAPEDYPEDWVQPYIGIATTDSPVAPTDASAYTWSKYVGKDGKD